MVEPGTEATHVFLTAKSEFIVIILANTLLIVLFSITTMSLFLASQKSILAVILFSQSKKKVYSKFFLQFIY